MQTKKTIVLEVIADEVRLSNLCQMHGKGEQGARCPVGYEFGCPFGGTDCAQIKPADWTGRMKED